METDTPTKITLAEARQAIVDLTSHRADGHEWDCQGCFGLNHRRDGTSYRTVTRVEYDRIIARCPHSREGDDPISRLDVLAILDRVDTEAPPDRERLARAIGATKNITADKVVELADDTSVSALDYPEEWFETSRELAGEIIGEWGTVG